MVVLKKTRYILQSPAYSRPNAFGISSLAARVSLIIRIEGWAAFLNQAFSYCRGRVFSFGTYYLYEKNIHFTAESPGSKPRVECEFKLISDINQLNSLVSEGYDPKVRSFIWKLEKGALAFCIFVHKELASVTWVGFDMQAKREIDNLPFTVEFKMGEVCSGASFTQPAFRGLELLRYTYLHIFNYLIQRQVTKDKFSINVKNTASQSAHAKLGFVIAGKWRYLKILGWENWKQRPN
jgi:hypothetical protein